MNAKKPNSNDTSPSSTNENPLESLLVKAADAEKWLRANANHAGEQVVTTRARIQDNLQVVKESMVAAEAAMLEHTRKAALAAGKYIPDNVWNWN